MCNDVSKPCVVKKNCKRGSRKNSYFPSLEVGDWPIDERIESTSVRERQRLQGFFKGLFQQALSINYWGEQMLKLHNMGSFISPGQNFKKKKKKRLIPVYLLAFHCICLEGSLYSRKPCGKRMRDWNTPTMQICENWLFCACNESRQAFSVL